MIDIMLNFTIKSVVRRNLNKNQVTIEKLKVNRFHRLNLPIDWPSKVREKSQLIFSILETTSQNDLVDELAKHLLYYDNNHSTRQVIIDKVSLASYEFDDEIIRVKDYQGDAWFNELSLDGSNSDYSTKDIIKFHRRLVEEYYIQKDPIKLRSTTFSIYKHELAFDFISLTGSDDKTIYLFVDKIVIIDEQTDESIQFNLDRPLYKIHRKSINKLIQVKWILYPLFITLFVIFMVPFSRLDIRPPILTFNPLTHEIGQEANTIRYLNFDSEGYINRGFYDNIFVSNYDITMLQDPIQKSIQFEIIDFNGNSRRYPLTLTVQDTTKPVIERSNKSGTLTFEELLDLNYSDFLIVRDNHRIKEITPLLPQDLVSPIETYPLGSYFIEIVVTDESGNRSSSFVSLLIRDQTPPILLVSDENLSFPIENYNDNTLTSLVTKLDDNHDNSTLSLSITTDYEADETGFFSATFVATDGSNNITTQSIQFEVYDRTPPEVIFVDDVAFGSIPDKEIIKFLPSDFVLSSRDNYKIKSISGSDITSPGALSNVFTYVVSVEDYGGNVVAKEFPFLVLDTTSPQIELLTTEATISPSSGSIFEVSNSEIQAAFIKSLTDNFRGAIDVDVQWPENRSTSGNSIRIIATDASENSTSVDVVVSFK